MERGVVIGGVLVVSSLILAVLLNVKSSDETAHGTSTPNAAPVQITPNSQPSVENAGAAEAVDAPIRISTLPARGDAVPPDPTLDRPAM